MFVNQEFGRQSHLIVGITFARGPCQYPLHTNPRTIIHLSQRRCSMGWSLGTAMIMQIVRANQYDDETRSFDNLSHVLEVRVRSSSSHGETVHSRIQSMQ